MQVSLWYDEGALMNIFTRDRILSFPAVAALLVTGAMTSAHAEGPRYTYLELGYVNIELDDPGFLGEDPDGDGFAFGGSVAVADMVHLFAGYTDSELDFSTPFGKVDVDYRTLSLGVGLNYAIASNIDLVGRLAYVNAEAKALGEKVDEDGYGISGGVRAMVTEQFELNGFVNYVDLGSDVGDDTSVSIGGLYNFTDLFAVGLGGEFGSDVRVITVGVRFYFGNR